MASLNAYLVASAGLFCLGVFAVLWRRHALAALMGIELMLIAASLNFVAFARFGDPHRLAGQAFALLALVTLAAQAAVGSALALGAYRQLRKATGKNPIR